MAENQEARYDVYRLLTQITHGDLKDLVADYTRQLNRDPSFMVPLAVWLVQNHKIRDMVNAAVASLVFYSGVNQDLQAWVREVGLGLLNQRPIQEYKKILEYGLSLGTLPRSVKTETRHYLQKLEANPNWDQVAVGHRRTLQWLYARTHSPMGDMAYRCLVEKNPPENTAFWAVQQAARVNDVYEKAALLVKYNVPYLVMTTFLSPKDPVALLALVDTMTPQQLANNLKRLENAGVKDNAEVWAHIQQKLNKGAKRGKVNVGRLGHAAEKVGAELAAETLNAAIGAYKITKSTAVFLDRSSSMHAALALLQHVGPYIATAAANGGANVGFFAFNARAQQLPIEWGTYQEFKAILSRYTPHGMTSFGAPIDLLQGPIEQFVYITDQQETCGPYFGESYTKYAKKFNIQPNVVVIHVSGRDNDIARQCADRNIPCDIWQFTGDYNQITPILERLAGKSFYEIIDDILSIEMPKRLRVG